jgi:hypothetical protein
VPPLSRVGTSRQSRKSLQFAPLPSSSGESRLRPSAGSFRRDLSKGVVNARRLSDNKIQLKFRTKEFEGEYFHYTGDLFLIYKTGHLMKLMCEKREG